MFHFAYMLLISPSADFLQIHKAKAEKAREKHLKEEMDAKRNALLADVEEEQK